MIQGFQSATELEQRNRLEQLLGPRLVSAQKAASLMLASSARRERGSLAAANEDDFHPVRVCLAPEERVAKALHTLALHTGITIKQIAVLNSKG